MINWFPAYFLGLLVFLFAVIRYIDSVRGTKKDSNLTKSRCYFGIGLLTLFYLILMNPDDMGISAYAGALCFIESIDLYYDEKKLGKK